MSWGLISYTHHKCSTLLGPAAPAAASNQSRTTQQHRQHLRSFRLQLRSFWTPTRSVFSGDNRLCNSGKWVTALCVEGEVMMLVWSCPEVFAITPTLKYVSLSDLGDSRGSKIIILFPGFQHLIPLHFQCRGIRIWKQGIHKRTELWVWADAHPLTGFSSC